MDRAEQSSPSRLRVGVIVGSTRPGRQARAIAEWVCDDPIAILDLHLVDLADVDLPLLSEAVPAAFGDYQQPSTASWSEQVATFDGFVLVTPEYNHSTSAVLKNALDHLYQEWRDKPVAFVGYGLEGGTRAVEHLRGIVAELGMAGVGPQVAVNLVSDYSDGHLEPRPRQSEQRHRMLNQLALWAESLRALRLRKAPRSTPSRPRLDDPSSRRAGLAAADRLLEHLRAGLEKSDADVYDQMFSDDVLWGSPYGATVAGFKALNGIHHSLMAKRTASLSSYELVQMLTPAPGIAVAHVRRTDLAVDTGQRFSEMALYVLVEREGSWWLAAGQNTPILEPAA